MQNGLLATLQNRLTNVASIELAFVLSFLQDVAASDAPDDRFLTHGSPFSSRCAYSVVSSDHKIDLNAGHIGRSKAPTKDKIFGWLLCRDRFSKMANLHRKTISPLARTVRSATSLMRMRRTSPILRRRAAQHTRSSTSCILSIRPTSDYLPPALLLTSLQPGRLLPLLQATRPPPAPSPGHAPFRRAPPPGDVATAPFLLPASTLPEVEGDAADPAVQAEQISRGRGAGEASPPSPPPLSTFPRGRRQSSWERTYRVLQIGPLGGIQNGRLSDNHVALIMTGMERMMMCPKEYINELASSVFSSCTRVPDNWHPQYF
ncbi:uncharacterized protein [Triticum aestivum]|uniref:uncharacterized protein n=1 Tax=Triticum aestivum TaxID=4565 RepID=UPI001D02A5FF|nr:uncharacterized protein LOC123060526 [Triticum aestivum]